MYNLGYCNCVLKHSYQGGVEFMEHFSSFLLVFQLLNHLDSLSNILQKRKKENNRNHVKYHINLIFATICSIKEERSGGTVD